MEYNKAMQKENTTNKRTIKKIIWQEEKKEECLNILNAEETVETITKLTEELQEIEPSLNEFYATMNKIVHPMEKMITIGGKPKKNIKEWFDRECMETKKKAMKALRKLNRTDNSREPNKYMEIKQTYIELRTKYHKLLKDKKLEYRKKIQEQLIENSKDSKKFWNMIKRASYKKKQTG